MRKQTLFLFFLLSIILPSIADDKNKEVIYFGQEFPGDVPVRFAPGKVSTELHEHSRIEFSSDGMEMYWSVYPVPFDSGSQFIRYSKYENGSWSNPKTISFSGAYRDSTPSFSSDNQYLYFDSWRPMISGGEINNLGGIWRSKRNATGWDEPEFYLSLNKGKYISNTMIFSANNNIYIDSGLRTEKGVLEWEIRFASYENGQYSELVTLGSEINSTKINWTPYVDKDETLMIFSSHERSDDQYQGDGDLYISFKDANGKWTEAINMGEKVNTGQQERYASLSPDGKYLFFARHTAKNYSDIFWVDSAFIDALKDRALNK